MKDIRITIRLTQEEHEKFKLYAVKQKQPMNQIIVDYIREIIEKGDTDGNT